MKSILTEIVLSGGAIMLWALALPVAVVIFAAIALWEKTTALVRGTTGPGCARPSPMTA